MNIKDIPIFWINLNRDTEKRKNMESMFDKYGFTNHTRISGTRNNNSIVGCAISHLYALEEMSPDSGFLILEDDCAVTEWTDDWDIELPNVDLIYFGNSLWGREPDLEKRERHHDKLTYLSKWRSDLHTVHPDGDGSGPWVELHKQNGMFRKITNMLSTHAIYYGTSKAKQETIRVMKENLNSNEPQHIDWLFADILQKKLETVAFDSPIFYQDDFHKSFTTKVKLSEYHSAVNQLFKWGEDPCRF